MTESLRWDWLGLAVVALLGLLATCGPPDAQAHSWYDGACCNEGDCYRTAQSEVQLSENGWFIRSTGEVIPFGDPRLKLSQDPFIHRCIFKTAILGGARAGDTRCLYIQGGM